MRLENLPDTLLDHAILPCGNVPVTVALHFTDQPIATGEGEHETEVVVAVPVAANAEIVNGSITGSVAEISVRSKRAAVKFLGNYQSKIGDLVA